MGGGLHEDDQAVIFEHIPLVERATTLTRKDYWWLLGIASIVGIVLLVVIDEPGYTDAYYYNAVQRLADGDGLTDPYLWNFLNAPDELPVPSHTYWMPLSSLLMAGLMAILAQLLVAQLPSVLAYWINAYNGVAGVSNGKNSLARMDSGVVGAGGRILFSVLGSNGYICDFRVAGCICADRDEHWL
ncbi:MAG: hypothetical protein R3C10_28305 [Pirellulales bacterium]